MSEPLKMPSNASPLTSVVIASYNTARYLPTAVRSALDQSLTDLEVVVVDDGSTDRTAEVVGKIEDQRLRYIFQANRGQAAAKNKGIISSRGKYVAFLDADDAWEPGKLASQVRMLEADPGLGVVYSRMRYIDEAGNDRGVNNDRLLRGRVSEALLVSNFVGFSSSVVRKECFDAMGLFNDRLDMGIDYELWLRLSTRYAFDFDDHPLTLYRIWPGQMSKNWKRRYENGIAIMSNFLRSYPDAIGDPAQKAAWAHTYAGYAHCMRKLERNRRQAIALYCKALSYSPTYMPAWRGILAACLGR
jgi:glycosyltransferase involved in cell wall biosynthesis